MSQPANRIIHPGDTYATAVMLLKVGANLSTDRAAELVEQLDDRARARFAAWADADDSAPEAIDQFISNESQVLAASGLYNLAAAVARTDPDRWSR